MGNVEIEDIRVDVAVTKEKVRQLEEREKEHIKTTINNTKNIAEVDKKVIKNSAIISTIIAVAGFIAPYLLKLFS